MKVKVLKSDSHIAFIDGLTCVPIIANSFSVIKKEALNEVYRISNYLEKRLPKDANNIELLPVETVKESVKNLDENIFSVGFNKKAYGEYKSLFINSAFSFKCMVDSLASANEYLSGLVKIISETVNLKSNALLIETAFLVAESLDELFKTNELLAYKRMVKLCYLVTSHALNVYNAEKLNNKIEDVFYFDV